MTPSVRTDPALIDELLTRGVAEVIPHDELKRELLSGRKLRIKLGIDPTSPHLHLGRAIPLLKLRDFQQLGHQIVFIVGDFTAVIGDTSDKDAERPMLARDVIEENKKHYFEQAGKILDLSKTEVRYNTEWLEKLTYREIGEHADLFSVADFITRENIARRLEAGKRVSLREVLYPLMQGYDSVAIQADVELGGTDQKFNLLAGRPLQIKFGQKPQSILMNPLIEGLDGRKMSSSWGNTLNLTDVPADMYGKVMSLKDELIERYFVTSTRVPMGEIPQIMALHPRDAKMRLAREIVTLYHTEAAAGVAEGAFVKIFSEGGIPDDLPSVAAGAGAALADVLLVQGVVSSKTEFRRLVEEGAVTNVGSGQKITDPGVLLSKSCTIKVGKRRFLKIDIS